MTERNEQVRHVGPVHISDIGTQKYKVLRIYRNSGRKVILYKGLTEKEAQRIVKSFPSNEKSMVIYTKH
jgi:hypothetical protein